MKLISVQSKLLACVLGLFFLCLHGRAQCEADHTIVMADYYFAPSELTILPGETVAFVNVQGTHDVNGITNTLTGESWSNPSEFYLEQTEGTEEGACMGVVTFDIPGVYNFDSSIGFQAQLGMLGTITVDAFTLLDLMLSWNNDESTPSTWQSTYAMQYSCLSCADALTGISEYTVFLPNDDAIAALGDLMNLGQFDMLDTPDFQDILEYHIVEGIYLAEDLEPGMALPTLLGEDAIVGQGVGGGLAIDGANIVETNYTADNGVVHIIDYGMAPSSSPEATVYQIVVESPNHTLFEQEIVANLLNDDLMGQPVIDDNGDASGPFTVFAPTDEAIIAFAEENGFDDVDDLFDSPDWGEILYRHIVEVPLTSNQLGNNGLHISYGGDPIYSFVEDDDIFIENALITAPDLLAYNGVVHVIKEVIDLNLPNPVGSCGTWTLNMFAPNGEGWSGVMQVFVDNILVGEPTVLNGFSSSYAFAVNEGSVVDMNYVSMFAGWPGNFEVVDAEGTVLFDSDSPNNSSQFGFAAGVSGLKACDVAPECSEIKVTLYSNYDGWDVGSLFVYDGLVIADVIGGYWFNGQTLVGYVDIQDGDDINFVVNSGSYSESYSYKVEDEDGNLLVDQVDQNLPAQSVYGIVICSETGIDEDTVLNEARFVPNPAEGSVMLSGIASDVNWAMTVRTLLGKEVLFQNGQGQSTLDLSSLPAGSYLGQMQTQEGTNLVLRLVVR